MKKISIVSRCFNEENNLEELYERVTAEWKKYADKYEFEYILLDNGSIDGTAEKLKELANRDKRIKVIINSRDFGQNNSPLFGIINATGDAVILIVSDLQDPPELISDLISEWEKGNQIVFLQKIAAKENFLIYKLRKLYYKVLKRITDNGVELAENCTGSGLFDSVVVDELRKNDDPNPFLRGLICEVGFKRSYVKFSQPARKEGHSCNNLYSLYSLGMLGVTKFSKLPLRIMAITGFLMSIVTFILAIIYFILKIVFWDIFSFGLAPLILIILFLGSMQMFCLGILGEYIATIYYRIDKKPLVVVKEKINF